MLPHPETPAQTQPEIMFNQISEHPNNCEPTTGLRTSQVDTQNLAIIIRKGKRSEEFEIKQWTWHKESSGPNRMAQAESNHQGYDSVSPAVNPKDLGSFLISSCKSYQFHQQTCPYDLNIAEFLPTTVLLPTVQFSFPSDISWPHFLCLWPSFPA